MNTGAKESYPADAVVFAVGISAMQKLVATCPALSSKSDFRRIMNLKVQSNHGWPF